MGIMRVYFYDMVDGKPVEREGHGEVWIASGGFVPNPNKPGTFIRGFRTEISVKRFGRPENASTIAAAEAGRRIVRTGSHAEQILTAAEFGGPVLVKFWDGPTTKPEWFWLVPEGHPIEDMRNLYRTFKPVEA